jgi:hypothetical protein
LTVALGGDSVDAMGRPLSDLERFRLLVGCKVAEGGRPLGTMNRKSAWAGPIDASDRRLSGLSGKVEVE